MISAHMVVKNDEKWVWFAINSVLDFVDEIRITNTGSQDQTDQIIKSISSKKIIYNYWPVSSKSEMTQVRQSQLKHTTADWVLILDADEIWPEKSIRNSLAALDNSLDYLITHYVNCVGDIFHIQPEWAGKYNIQGRKGHISIRYINIAKNKLHYECHNEREGLYTKDNMLLQKLPTAKWVEVQEPYLHTTHLARSSASPKSVPLRPGKYKHELGLLTPTRVNFPPCMYIPKPSFVSNPWTRRSLWYTVNASWQTPLRYLNRCIFK